MKKIAITLSLLMLALPLALAACSSDGGGGTDPVEVAEVPAAMAAASCGWAFRCCTDAELADQNMTDEASCITAMTTMVANGMGALEDAIAAGRGSWDASIAGNCLANAADATCTSGSGNNMASLLADCEGLYSPTQGAGDECNSGAECQANLYCTDDGTNPGTCEAIPNNGEDCSTVGYCRAGNFCDAGTCATQLTAGTECDNAVAFQCAAGLACEGTPPVCTEVPAVCTGR